MHFRAYFLENTFKVRDVSPAAHAKAREAIKSAAPHVKLGMTLAPQENIAAPDGEALVKRIADEARTPFFEAARHGDFVGIQTCNGGLIGPNGYLPPPTATIRDSWARDASPSALQVVAHEAFKATGRPIFITENGLNAHDDRHRVRHSPSPWLRLLRSFAAVFPSSVTSIGTCSIPSSGATATSLGSGRSRSIGEIQAHPQSEPIRLSRSDQANAGTAWLGTIVRQITRDRLQ